MLSCFSQQAQKDTAANIAAAKIKKEKQNKVFKLHGQCYWLILFNLKGKFSSGTEI